MEPRKNYIATKSWSVLTCALVLAGVLQAESVLAADMVGTVTDLSGSLLVRRADGTVKVLAAKSEVDQGDTLVSEKDTYARIKFIDNGEITLRPNTQFKIDNFTYNAAKPENDNAFFTLVKGGLRSITGLLGKRNKERFGLNTPTATIGIRGTIFIAEYVQPAGSDVASYEASSMAGLDASLLDSYTAKNVVRTDAPRDFLPKSVYRPWQKSAGLQLAQNIPDGSSGEGRNPGLYVQVLDGMIHVSNGGGAQNFTAGQFGFTPGFQQPPVILPSNPGIQFSPPPSFSTTTGTSGASTASKPGGVDCVVR